MSKAGSEVHLDEILVELGSFGKFQLINYCVILVPILFSAIFNIQYVFAAGAVDYRCVVPECESPPVSFEPGEWGLWALPEGGGQCERLQPVDDRCTDASFHVNQTVSCSHWVYQNYNTIVAEFDLACQNWKRTLVGTIHNAGVFTALPLTAFISDTYGRRLAFIVTAMAAGVVGVARSFVTSYVPYLVLEYLEATVGSGVYSTGFILALEMVGLNHRVLGGNIISSTFAIGQVVTALVAWAVPYWRTYTQVIYAPAIFFLLYFFVIEESVRWLLSKGKKAEAATIIFKVADMNKKKLSPASIEMLTVDPEEQIKPIVVEVQTPRESRPSIFMEVIKSKTLITRLLICSVWWITLTFVYYGLSINSVSLAGNSYVNYILTSLVEIPGYCISVVTLDRFGRKKSIITAFFTCGVSLVVLPFIPMYAWLQVTLNMVGKLSISMAFSSVYIYTSELMPTTARHSLLGFCSMIGRIGSLVAPQTPLLMVYMESLPYLIFGVMAITSGLLMMLTPETLRTRLPDTVHQAENIVTDTEARRRTDSTAVQP